MIRSFFDLSLRYKIPIWGSVLILAAAASVATALIVRGQVEQRESLFVGGEALGRYLGALLSDPLSNDDPWAAFEIARSVADSYRGPRAIGPQFVLVLDRRREIFASTHPREYRMLTPAASVSGALREIVTRIDRGDGSGGAAMRAEDGDQLYVTTRIVAGDDNLGHVVIAYSRDGLERVVDEIAVYAIGITLLVLILLLPAHLYWTSHTVQPVLTLADRMRELGKGVHRPLARALYPYDDEIGQLFDAYARMLDQLGQKAMLEKEIVKSERLTSLGRLSSGIAHEINNPLAGLLTATSTLRMRVGDDPRLHRTVDLIERGLLQIRDTVASLLVEARFKPRDLEPRDVDDVRTLVEPLARKNGLELVWRNQLSGKLPLPANMIRQVLMNLLMNAIGAARVRCEASAEVVDDGDCLRVSVIDDGDGISAGIREHLFEPFVSTGGTGLGLWVSYQIVSQLRGRIEVHTGDGETRFDVRVPIVASGA